MGFPQLEGKPLSATIAELSYLKNDPRYLEDKPYYCSTALDPRHEHFRTNQVFEARTTQFRDLRGLQDSLDFDTHGVAYLSGSEARITANPSPEEIVEYLRSSARVVKAALRAERCICYSYRFRKSSILSREPGVATGSYTVPDEPAANPHVDQTHEGGFRRLKYHLSNTPDSKYLDGNWRLRIVNVWRPLGQIVERDPLALCDPATVSLSTDLIAADRVGNSYVGEIYYLKYNPAQKWYWLSDQTSDEMVMFNSFDSHSIPDASFVPHCSFKDPNAGADAAPRESIELRMIVISAI